MLKSHLRKEIQCLLHTPQALWVAVTFSLGVFLIFPFVLDLGVGALNVLFPALLWLSLFFSLFLTVDHFYATEFSHQIFHHLYARGDSLFMLVLLKILIQACFILFLHSLLLPLLVMFYQIDVMRAFLCVPYLILGVASLALLVHFAHILILSLKQKGMLSLLILLPLMIPVLIFGSFACHQTLMGEEAGASVYFLSAIFLLTLGVLPYTSAQILTEAVKQ